MSRAASGWTGGSGRKFLHPGPGFGGSCFPKDTLALVRIAQDAGAPSRLVEAVVAVNDVPQGRHGDARHRRLRRLGARASTIGVLGLTFKPETDDMRDSPALPIVSRLVGDGAVVQAFDPQGMEQARPLLPEGVRYCHNAMEAVAGADALVVVTEWNEFRALSPERLETAMRGDVVVDLRNIYDPVAMTRGGICLLLHRAEKRQPVTFGRYLAETLSGRAIPVERGRK